jgi:hypothetical protein
MKRIEYNRTLPGEINSTGWGIVHSPRPRSLPAPSFSYCPSPLPVIPVPVGACATVRQRRTARSSGGLSAPDALAGSPSARCASMCRGLPILCSALGLAPPPSCKPSSSAAHLGVRQPSVSWSSKGVWCRTAATPTASGTPGALRRGAPGGRGTGAGCVRLS